MEETTTEKEEGNREKDHTHWNISETTPDNGHDGVICYCSFCFSFGWKYIIEGGKHVLFAPPPVQFESGDRNEPLVRQKNMPTGEEAPSSSKIDCKMCRLKGYRPNLDNGAGNVLLRVRKEDLRNAKCFGTRGAAETVVRHIDQLSSFSRSSLYSRHIVAPYLVKYIDVTEPVELSRNFLASLYDNAMASGKIPPSRLKDWTLVELSKEDVEPLRTTGIGTFVKAYRSSLIVSLDQHRDPRYHVPFAIEFKPKAGYLALTPFVLPQRRHLKYKQSRFVSLQQLQQRGLWTKGWSATSSASMASASTSEATTNNSRIRTATTTCCDETNDTGPIRMSLYDPVKVFQHVVSDAQKVTTTLPSRRLSEPLQPHGEDDGIETTSAAIPSVSCLEETISCLLDNPQNNLRCFVGDVDILSEGEENASLTSKRQLLLDSIFGSSTSSSDEDTHEKSIPHNNEDKTKRQKPQNSLNDLLQEILVHVFTSHDGVDLLSRIHKWQSDLDIIDVDGALLVYDRLVELLKQQHQDGKDDVHIRAQHLVDCITEADLKKIIDGGLEFDDHSDYPSFLSASPFNFDFCRVKGSTLVCDLFDEVQGFQNLVSESYPDLPAEDVLDSAHQKCLDIVGNLNIEGCRFLLQNWLLSLMMCDISIFILLQSTVPPTAADLSSNMKKNSVKLSDGLWYEFQLRVIDTDQKPSSKIPRKREKEKAFD
mmetsp:Transcript_39518/g.95493  ORF Transcript_39518/g.95493 Transcript_39518/m.95493 type:complete len:707 (-) Transcript_39518:52-2172(-)